MYKQLFECQNIIRLSIVRRLQLKTWNSVHFISQQMQEDASVGSVDCQKYRSFCQEQGVNSYPTIRLYPHNSQGARRFVWVLKWVRAMLVSPWKMVSVSVRCLFYQPMDENIKTWTLRFPPPKKTLIWRRHCSIGQSCCSMTSKRRVGWFLESSRPWSFSAERSPNQSKATRLCIRSINQSNRSISVRFHFKVIRKSLY